MIKIFELGDTWFLKIENHYCSVNAINYVKFIGDGICLLSVAGTNEPYILDKKQSAKLQKFLEKQGTENWQTDEDD